MKRIIQVLARNDGGYILIGSSDLKLKSSNGDNSNSEEQAAKLRALKKFLLQKVIFVQNHLFVPVEEPTLHDVDGTDVFVISGPAMPTRWYERRPTKASEPLTNDLWLRSAQPKRVLASIHLGRLPSLTN